MFGLKKSMSKNKTESPAAEPAETATPPPVASTLSHEQIEDLQNRAAKADENWERLLRTTADFDNFKKRAAREKQEAIKFGNESLLQKLVPVLDHFDMALAAAQAGGVEATKPLQD